MSFSKNPFLDSKVTLSDSKSRTVTHNKPRPVFQKT